MLSVAVERYITLGRATGRKLVDESSLLHQFAGYAARRGEVIVRTGSVLEWAALGRSQVARRKRLLVVRRFALSMCAEDPRHELPPPDAFGPVPPRRMPRLFAPEEIRALLDGAAALGPRGSLRPKTYTALFGLLACTGLRISEALALEVADITDAGLVIRSTKFHKSRLVPLHETTRHALRVYLVARERYAGDDQAVFISKHQTAIRYPTVIGVFLQLARAAGIHPGPGRSGPRIHDLRHTFAVRSLESCSADPEAVAQHMLALGTYLGHARPAHTFWYLQTTPRLFVDIVAQTEALAMRGAR